IPVLGFLTPADGYFKLLFYATTNDYVKYRDTYLNGHNDSRVKAVYNIQGGAGIFAGMLVDTFNIYIRPLGEMKLYGYHEAQDAYCRTLEFGQSAENYKIRRQCLEIWDAILWCEVLRGRPSSGIVCGFDYYLGRPWYNLPAERLKQLLTPSEFITWCRYRDFPIYEYPACGSAMVRHSKSGVKSPILDREVKKWCEANKDDVECGA
ncbi:MAG: hypothetical protein LBC85_04710, partial [Fibromonadaceae bacterium]|nr:hypothetical protein [Fibromonadaceae bacterium]